MMDSISPTMTANGSPILPVSPIWPRRLSEHADPLAAQWLIRITLALWYGGLRTESRSTPALTIRWAVDVSELRRGRLHYPLLPRC